MKKLTFRLHLGVGLICAVISSSPAMAGKEMGGPENVPDGTSALLLFVDGKAMTPVYYRYIDYCQKALKAIEAKVREANPKLEVFGICTPGAGDSTR